MSKAVLMSIQPQWVEKIASGEKTIEVRKTKPKLEMPFKVYIYCTKSKKHFLQSKDNMFFYCEESDFIGKHGAGLYQRLNGKVIGEFVCDRIDEYSNGELALSHNTDETCLTNCELADYIEGSKAYFWHISQLKIYDKPKELNEFYARCNIPESKCKLCDNCYDREDYYGRHYAVKKITRPSQSWCYVEE